MSITDELREYALGWDERNRVRCDLTAIADRIDAEHERQLEVLYRDMSDAACKPITYDNGYSTDHLEPGEYHEFWEPACACGNCGELIPMRKFCPNCGCRLEVGE